jgi:hypothetical protein
MAKDIKLVKSESNFTGFDKETLRQGCEKALSLREEIAANNQAIGAHYKYMENEIGINKQGLKLGLSFAKMSDEKRSDQLRTFFAVVSAMELLPQKDLVDLMED